MNVDPVRKDPRTSTDYSIDWAPRPLGALTISSSVWTPPAGITVTANSNTTTTTTVRLSGGTDGQTYDLLNTVTLSNGQTDISVLRVQVRFVEFWTLTDAEKVTVATIAQETLETIEDVVDGLNGSQVASLLAKISEWNDNRGSVDIEVSGEVIYKPTWLLAEIRSEVRKILGLPLYSLEVQPGSYSIPVRAVF